MSIATPEVELVAPAALANQTISETVTERINTFMNQVNQLGLDMKTDVMNESVLALQQHIDEYTTQVEIASKVANSVVKAINSLDNMQ